MLQARSLDVGRICATVMDPAFDAIIGYRGRIAIRNPAGGFDLRDFLLRCGRYWRSLPPHIQNILKERFTAQFDSDGTVKILPKKSILSAE